MGRRKVIHAQVEKPAFTFVFKLDVEIDLSGSYRPKVAFLSGLGRSYYPEDPGYSKFGQVYQIEDEVPPCNYTPPEDRLYGRPISKRGYGIGGLTGPRFAPNVLEENPSPDKYQKEVTPPLLDPHRARVPENDDVYTFSSKDPYVLRKRMAAIRQRRRQCTVSFGSQKYVPRMPNHHAYDTAGVGSYNIAGKKKAKPIATSAFGRAPIVHELSTDIHCVCAMNQRCIECGKEFKVSDYYRTRHPVHIPYPETRTRAELEKDFPVGIAHVNLCNICYIRALKGESNNWPEGPELRKMFKKARTCATMHERETPPDAKESDRRTVRKLRMKESILAKYYPDNVEQSLEVRYGR